MKVFTFIPVGNLTVSPSRDNKHSYHSFCIYFIKYTLWVWGIVYLLMVLSEPPTDKLNNSTLSFFGQFNKPALLELWGAKTIMPMKTLLLLTLVIILVRIECNAQSPSKGLKVFTPCEFTNNSTKIHVKCVVRTVGDTVNVATYHTQNQSELNPYFRLRFLRSQAQDTVKGTCDYPLGKPFAIKLSKQKSMPQFWITSDSEGIQEVQVINLQY